MHLTGDRDRQINEIRGKQGLGRYGNIFRAHRAIDELLKEILEAELPYRSAEALAEMVRDGKNGESEPPLSNELEANFLPMRASVLGQVLLLQCDLGILSDVLSVREQTPVDSSKTEILEVDFSRNRDDCDDLIRNAGGSQQRQSEAQGHIFWVYFEALERAASPKDEGGVPLDGEDSVTRLLTDALQHLQAGEELCKAYQDQTVGISQEIGPLRDMLQA
jgi:hypothetical protein